MLDIYKYLQNKFELVKNDQYRNFDIDINTKKLLCDIGLPVNPVDFIEFDIYKIKNIILENKYIVIGNDFGTKICVINHTNEIVSFDDEYEYPIRFINSNLENLINFIRIFLMYYEELNTLEGDKLKVIINIIKKAFNDIDFKALSSDENWWSIILEQLELEC